MLWPFKNNKVQKVIAAMVLGIGGIIAFNTPYLTYGAALALLGIVYLTDSI